MDSTIVSATLELVRPIIGAFFGALLAFLFGLWALVVQKRREQWVRHLNAMVEIEILMAEAYNVIESNRGILAQFRKAVTDPEGKPVLFWGIFNSLPTIRHLHGQVQNRALTLELFKMSEMIRPANDNYTLFEKQYADVRGAVISQNINSSHYAELVAHISDTVSVLNQQAEELKQQITKLVAHARVVRRFDESFNIFLFAYKTRKSHPVTEQELSQSLTKVHQYLQKVKD